MTASQNQVLIRRWLRMGEQGFTGDFEEFFTPGYRGHLSGQPPQTLADLIRLERAFAASFSNISYGVEDLFSAGDKVVLRVKTSAVHIGTFHGIEPTHRCIFMTGIVIYRFETGKIAESWGELDLLGLFRQIKAS